MGSFHRLPGQILGCGATSEFSEESLFAPAGGLSLLLANSIHLPGGAMRFELNATAGSFWQLQGSPDVVHWANYESVSNKSGTTAITNTPRARPDAYFYRVAEL